MKRIFDPISLGKLELKNRIVRSATIEHYGSSITPEMENILVELAKGGVGLIITGMVGVKSSACISNKMVLVEDSRFVEDLRRITEQVHLYGSKIIVQIAHCGAKAGDFPKDERSLAPSEITLPTGNVARAMTVDEIKEVPALFARAAALCGAAGADGVQLHGAHGYLLSQFLSPYFNKRKDEYGGSIENRSRLVTECFDAVKKQTSPGFSIMIKLNHNDLVEESVTEEDCLWVCRALEEKGIDAIEISGGIGLNRKSLPSRPVATPDDEGSFAEAALRLSAKLQTPVISVCGYRSPEKMNEWLNKGNIELMALSRPLIIEPDLINRWQQGDASPSRCISCNRCLRFDNGLHCQKPQ